jgi:acyl carrier protein
MNMISQLTNPEGPANYCPICKQLVHADPSTPTGDAPCPRCGHLLWWFGETLSQSFGISPEQVTSNTSFVDDLAADSLDVVELIMELEDEFDIAIPDADYERIRTVGDAIRYVEVTTREEQKG